MNSGKKIIRFDAPSAENDLTTNPPEIEMFDDAGAEQEFSNIFGRRNECKSKGLKPFTKEFRDCLKGLRSEDKGKSWSELHQKTVSRRADHQEATAEGKEKQGFLGKAFHGLKAGILSGQRIPYLVLLRFNVWNMAANIANLETLKNKGNAEAKAKWNKLLAHWVHWGGSVTEFKHNMNLGKKKKALLVRPSKRVKLLSFDGEDFSYTDGGVAEAIVSSAPVWIPIVGMLAKKVKGEDPNAGLAMNPQDQAAAIAAANQIPPLTPEQLAAADAERARQEAGGSPKGDNTIYYVVGGALAIAVIGFIAYKHFHKTK